MKPRDPAPPAAPADAQATVPAPRPDAGPAPETQRLAPRQEGPGTPESLLVSDPHPSALATTVESQPADPLQGQPPQGQTLEWRRARLGWWFLAVMALLALVPQVPAGLRLLCGVVVWLTLPGSLAVPPIRDVLTYALLVVVTSVLVSFMAALILLYLHAWSAVNLLLLMGAFTLLAWWSARPIRRSGNRTSPGAAGSRSAS